MGWQLVPGSLLFASVLAPMAVDPFWIRRPGGYQEAVFRDIFLPGLDAEFSGNHRGKAEIRFAGVQSDVLRPAKILWTAKRRQGGIPSVELATHGDPVWTRMIALPAILAITGQEFDPSGLGISIVFFTQP